MRRRYLFGPVDAAFAAEYLDAPRGSGECLTFGPDADIPVRGMPPNWEACCALLPAGWRPDFAVLYLPHAGIPEGLWQAPLPLVGLAADWRLHWHACRLLAPRCDLVLADEAGGERLRREGCAHVRTADLSGCGASFLRAEEPPSARDVDVLWLGELHPALERERAHWLGRLARLADRWRVLVAAGASGSSRQALLRRSRVVIDPGPSGGGGRLAAEAAASGCLPLSADDLEGELERYLGNEDEHRLQVDAARERTRSHTFEALWQAALGHVEECWPELQARASQRRPADRDTALRGRVWQALGPYGPDPTLVADLQAALTSEPASAELHNALGLVETLAGRVGGRITAPLAERAAGHFLRALRADPRHLLAALNLAEALAAVEQTSQAADLARRTLVLLGQEQAAGRPVPDGGHFPPAQDLFRLEGERAAWLNAGQPAAESRARQSLLRWRLHTLLGELTGDLVHYREAALARADLPAARAALGRALARAGRYTEALPHLRRALTANPCDNEAARALAEALAATGDLPGREALVAERRLLARAAPRLVRPEEWLAGADGGDELASVLVACRHSLEQVRACMESLCRHTRPPYELILLDQGCPDLTADYLAQLGSRQGPVRSLLLSNPNGGGATGLGRGLAETRGRYLVLLDDEVLVTEGWLEGLVAPTREWGPPVALVGPVSNNAPPAQQVAAEYANAGGLAACAALRRQQYAGQASEADSLAGFCLLLRREALELAGPGDGVEDLCLRVRQAGFHLLVARDVLVHRCAGQPLPEAPPDTGLLPGVSLCMIVRNEEANLATCLKSILDLVDEVILVDTGSTDRTREIAASFGPKVKVVDFLWSDDFAAARNESLRHATRRWVLWLDADEHFDEANRGRLRQLLSGLGDEPAAYTMRQLSVPAAPGGASSAVDHIRLFHNHPQIRWQYRVHEQILLSIRRLDHPVRFTDIVLRHAGYQDQALRQHKRQRNLALLERSAAERPDDPFVAFNLGWGYQQASRPADALPLLLHCREQLADGVSIRRKLHAVLVNALRDLGRRDEALAACQVGLAEYADDIELLFLEGLLRREGGDLDGAVAVLRRLLGVRPEQHFAMVDPDLGGYKARHNLALVYRQQGRLADAEREWRAVVAERPDCFPAWLCLGELFLAQQRWHELEEAARRAEAVPAARKDAAGLRARARAARDKLASAQPVRHSAVQSAAGVGRRQRVSLCMIVRNEETNLAACLRCVHDLVDEIIIVDTGSTDRTREIAASFGPKVKVVDFPWVDSFAAARNESLRHATGDWIFWLDGDDRIDEENRERLRELFARLDGDAAYVMKCRCVGDAASGAANAATSVVDHVRLFRNHPDLRWRYRVHEQILPAVRRLKHQVRRCDVVIDHTGYRDPALRQRKLERDLRLLLLEHAESPDDPFNLFNLGWLHIDRGRPDEALPFLRRSLELSAPTDSIVRKLHALITRCHRKAGRPQEALAACRAGLVQCPGDAELLFEEGLLLRGLGDREGAIGCFARLLVSGPGDHFASLDPGIWGYKAHHQLAEIRRDQGDDAAAARHWRQALAERPDFAPAWVGLGEVCLRRQDYGGLEEAARALEALPQGRMEGLVLRGRGLLARRAFAEARLPLEEAARLAPGSVWPLVILSHVLLQEGKDQDAAERVLRRILELEPRHEQAASNLAVLLRQRRNRA
jgi:glycosyltransferase involved in cell wall biosynthesis/Flp pilus assembly protein TadD